MASPGSHPGSAAGSRASQPIELSDSEDEYSQSSSDKDMQEEDMQDENEQDEDEDEQDDDEQDEDEQDEDEQDEDEQDEDEHASGWRSEHGGSAERPSPYGATQTYRPGMSVPRPGNGQAPMPLPSLQTIMSPAVVPNRPSIPPTVRINPRGAQFTQFTQFVPVASATGQTSTQNPYNLPYNLFNAVAQAPGAGPNDATPGTGPSPEERQRQFDFARQLGAPPNPAFRTMPRHAAMFGVRTLAPNLPRWQPDAEATYCPICHTQFSFLNRKHHCRKCGRVVCSACSPHRITIPHQYIVQPPGTPRAPAMYPASYITGVPSPDFPGGERVRLCNPCVPDPNIMPPQAQAQGQAQGQAQAPHAGFPSHARTQSTLTPEAAYNAHNYQNYGFPSFSQFARTRSATMGNQSATPSPGQYPPPGQFPGPQPGYYGPGIRDNRASSSRHYQGPNPGVPDVLASGSAPSSSSRPMPRPQQQQQPQPVRRQIAEEDECPVCHRELPSRLLPDFEAQREAHITACITTHSSYGTPTASNSGTPQASSASVPRPPRLSGMFPYAATEKDCVDSAECTICFEDFQVGDRMARLECLCRFHRDCINAWWERSPGLCPLHRHDGYGF